jgi:sortase (surface protein transpeptidase)
MLLPVAVACEANYRLSNRSYQSGKWQHDSDNKHENEDYDAEHQPLQTFELLYQKSEQFPAISFSSTIQYIIIPIIKINQAIMNADKNFAGAKFIDLQ